MLNREKEREKEKCFFLQEMGLAAGKRSMSRAKLEHI